LDAELPFAFESSPEPGAAPPPRDPAWTGLQIVIVILFTILAMLVVSIAAFLIWALAWRAAGSGIYPHRTYVMVALSLVGEAGGFAAGIAFFAFLLANVPGARFWQAIHWRRLKASTVGSLILSGAGLVIAVQLLSHVLPMPNQVPMDRLFTPRTAWLLVIYGVGLAPFFEEFFFRGLIYPSLRNTFASGFNAEEQHPWKMLVRLFGGLGLAGLGGWTLLMHAVAPARLSLGLMTVGAALLAALLVPAVYLGAAGWVAHRLAAWRQPELLAVLATGMLFGLMHGAQLGWSWAAVLLLALVGIFLTWVRAKTGSLMASWLVHCAYNGTLFLMTYFATQGFRHFGPGLN
jgi:membrane protease YdiL (CAAX protease family)